MQIFKYLKYNTNSVVFGYFGEGKGVRIKGMWGTWSIGEASRAQRGV